MILFPLNDNLKEKKKLWNLFPVIFQLVNWGANFSRLFPTLMVAVRWVKNFFRFKIFFPLSLPFFPRVKIYLKNSITIYEMKNILIAIKWEIFPFAIHLIPSKWHTRKYHLCNGMRHLGNCKYNNTIFWHLQ